MKNLADTRQFYAEKLHFTVLGEYGDDYLMMAKDEVEIHFFHFPQLAEADNYGMCYIRAEHIEELYTDFSANHLSPIG